MKYSFPVIFYLLFRFNFVVAQSAPAHIVILVLENKSYTQVVGSPLLPYINSLLKDPGTAVFTQSYGLTHPSQPNYLQLFSGSQQGVFNNNLPPALPFVTPNLGSALIQNGFSFTGYSEDLPSVGFTGDISGQYARKHNPWVNWQDSDTNGIPYTQNQPFTSFPVDFATLPTVSFVVPNQANDMHNATIPVAFPLCDAWLRNNLDSYIQWCKTNNSVFILTFDEDDGAHGNRIPTAVIGENVKGGSYNQPITHYNVLRTIEEIYHLPYAGASVDSTSIKDLWLTPVCKGGSKTLQSSLTGVSYQWQLDTGAGFNNIDDDLNYTGAHTAYLQLDNIPSAWYGYRYRCVVDGASSDPFTIRIVSHWTGAISAVWENALNWECVLLPDDHTDVIINTNASIILNSTTSVRSISLSGGTQLVQNGGANLTIVH